MNIVKKYSTTNTTYLKNRKTEYIVWHYTAGTSSKSGSAVSSASWFANSAAQSSADFIVDDTTIVQFNGDIENRYCWAVGGGKYNTKGGRLYGVASNKNCISIEICSNNTSGKITYPNDPRYSLTDASLNNALLLTHYLMEKYNIDADHVIRHYDVNGKECPGVIGWNKESGSESTWKKWHDKIENKSGDSTAEKPTTSTSSTATTAYGMKLTEIAKYIHAEFGTASGKNYNCLLGVAQTMKDMTDHGGYGSNLADVLKKNFTTPSSTYTNECLQAAQDVFVNGKKRFENAKIYQFRSFSKYSDGKGNPDKNKCASLYAKYDYIGSDSISLSLGHLYFGKIVNTSANTSTNSSTSSTLYRVGTAWKDGKCVNQDNAYSSLDNAKKRVDTLAQSGKTGYYVFDDKGVSVYPVATAEPVFKPYNVRVETPSLRIRKAPNGAVKKNLGKELYTGIGTFTIVDEEKAGEYTWGLLKSYEKKRNGWIALEYTKRV